MKRCHVCKNNLDESEFYKNSKRKDGLQTYCKSCSNKRRVKYFIDNKVQETLVRQKRVNEIKSWFQELKSSLKCSKCSETRHYVLDFHHTEDNKENNVCTLVSNRAAKTTILKEINKCIVLCRNCHAEHHYLETLARSSSG